MDRPRGLDDDRDLTPSVAAVEAGAVQGDPPTTRGTYSRAGWFSAPAPGCEGDLEATTPIVDKYGLTFG